MIWLISSGKTLAIRSEFGTVIAVAPSFERVRSMNVLPPRKTSIDSTITGDFTKSVTSTGRSMMASISSVVTAFRSFGAYSAARARVPAEIALAAAVCRKCLRVVGMPK